ncbi:L-seryl-tRNA(Sec) selenium transferase [Campylobacter rectus RM3267]|uniref:L-seryl-tRNA(Sec) selenium transferase n=2 Tax=Campylobacter rectus TaxID=203 RepID=A0A6G5QJV3_CAMRE|nr:L-seryl-tRNA(Sec) selenium transferase [Campylobacter rectus]EEF13128.1 L-seryl-tRNA(Sec) selenium transferase [Campylobacter rectus RM3267]QCD45978.1 selenocysteine synthase [Campylobacter rectus]RRD55454.1 L-seryl-tRNA(Sec) selenium transferase [Campylobacter rectus]UEB46698.1 L-seryl-tRNA(Sec) selenium transferase [Campylobacter rectus]
MNELRKLPQIDKFIKNERFFGLDISLLTKVARCELESLRAQILGGQNCPGPGEIVQNTLARYEKASNLSLRSLINATGVIIHTNLGRSAIDPEILRRAQPVITGYSNLEYSVEKGGRSNRYDYVGGLLAELFGFEDAIVVNNNASAVFLVLNTFSKGGEAIISRGELVEIGGSFRVPEVMANSGAILREVGTTNKTNLHDYEEAINENSKLILKVHRSNFDIVGFSEDTAMPDLSALAKEQNLIDYFDLGSGFYGELPYGLERNEPNLKNLKEASLVSFSGDKLFGSVQCGIILGKKGLIAKLKKNQLLRMLRVDKVIISLLAESIKAYANREFRLITTVKQLYKSVDELENTANFINSRLKTPLEIVRTTTFVGGGTMPNKRIPSLALAVKGNANENEAKFRKNLVIGRIEEGKFLLDLRSVLDADVQNLIEKINETDEK